jgi:hypothetical protein
MGASEQGRGYHRQYDERPERLAKLRAWRASPKGLEYHRLYREQNRDKLNAQKRERYRRRKYGVD